MSHHLGKGVSNNSTYSLLSNCLIKLTVEGVALCLELIIPVCGDWSESMASIALRGRNPADLKVAEL